MIDRGPPQIQEARIQFGEYHLIFGFALANHHGISPAPGRSVRRLQAHFQTPYRRAVCHCTLIVAIAFAYSAMTRNKYHQFESLHLILGLLGTTEETSAAGSNETSLLTLGGVAGDGRGFTDMLVVTTTVRMIDGVHSNTTSLGPRVALDGELVLRS